MMGATVFRGEMNLVGHLEAWYQSALGQSVLQAESEQLAGAWARVFGFHLLQLGSPNHTSQFIHSAISHQICVHPGPELAGSLQADFVALPFAENSIDAVLAPHVLEFSAHPQAVLAEAARVLLPEGRLLILGFNPTSLFGLKRLCCKKSKALPWQGTFASAGLIKKWLADLSFEVTDFNYFYYRPPLNKTSSLKHTRFLETWGRKLWTPGGAVYLISAKKKIAGLTPIRPAKIQKQRVKIRAAAIEPTTRGQTINDNTQ